MGDTGIWTFSEALSLKENFSIDAKGMEICKIHSLLLPL